MLTSNARPGCEAGDACAFQALHHLLAGHQQQQLGCAVSPDVVLHAMTPASNAAVMETIGRKLPSNFVGFRVCKQGWRRRPPKDPS